jgi:putative ABC transport system permease protein
MRWFSQVAALTAFNLRTMPRRKGSTAAALFGIAGVVAVFVGVLSIAQGFRQTMTTTGSPDTVIVVRSGSDSEMVSILNRDDTRIIAEAPGLAKRDGKPLASAELYVIVNLPMRSTGSDANVPLRGVHQEAFGVRDEVRITRGRNFVPGKNEIIVGRGALASFSGIDLGSELKFGEGRWTVVGIFEANGGLAESELWADAPVLAAAYRRGTVYQVVLAKLASPGSFQQYKDALTSDPRLNVKVVRETDYYAEQSELLYLLITFLGAIVSGLMGTGAVIGALNTMYTAVAARSREMATLKALGFQGSPVIISVIIESLVIAIAGGALGAIAAWIAFDGYRAATLNWRSFSQVAFAFDVNGRLLLEGILYAALIGVIGGLFPAIRASRLPVATALREG